MKAFARRIERARDYRNDGGFTLVEMLITIIIVGMITASMVAAFSLSIQTSTSASDRIKKSNAAQVITRFLVPDAASAGGYDDQNRGIVESGLTPGVWIQTGNTGGFCDNATSVVRFEWVSRANASIPVRIAANYAVQGNSLVRTYCTQPMPVGQPVGAATSSSLTLSENITNAVPTCIPSCGPGLRTPVIVTLTVTSTASPSNGSAYTFSASGFVRAGGSSGTPTTATVPLIALGITSAPCPVMKGGTGNSTTAQVAASGVAVAQKGTADPFEPKITVFGVAAINSDATSTPCGAAGNISAPTGWFASQTLVVAPGTCANCGPIISIPAPINDPFADLVPPTNGCGSGSGNPATTVVGNERHYFPGVYHNPVNLVIQGNVDQYIFENSTNGGVYIFCAGVTVTSGILAQSKPGGVLFYFAGGALRRITTGGSDDFSDINWQVDGRPEWRDIIFWQPNPTTANAATTGDMEIAIGENDPIVHPLSSRYGGVIYAPRAQVEFYLPTRETLGQYETVEATAAAVVARNIVADRISRIRLGDGPQTTVAVTANPNPSTVGQAVTLQATVSPVFPATGVASGVVTFYDDSDQLGTAPMINGVATFVTTTLGGGARPIKAIYSGDLVFASSVSPTLNTVLNPAPSTTTLGSSLNPAGTGQAVTFTATVAGVGGGPIPTGTVTFYDDVAALGSVALSVGGIATITRTLSEGLHPIRAVYNGDVSYLGSTSGVLQQAVKQASVVVLTSTPNPSQPGQQVTLTASVSPINPGLPATGTVTFYDGAIQIGGGAVVLDGAGVGTIMVSNLTGGSHNLTARYSGDMLLAPSTSSVHVHVTNFAGGAVGLTSSVNPSALNQSVTFTATVTGAPGLPTPTGTVIFYDGANPITGVLATSTRPLSGAGVATIAVATLPLGSRSITALYNGDANYLSATSPALTQLVQSTTSTTLTSNHLPSANWGQPVTFTATVTSNPAGSPTGNVEFYDNGALIGQAAVAGGTASITTSATWFDTGSHPITAVYVPSGAQFTGSTSAVLNQVINLATTTLTVTSTPNPVAPGQSFTLSATVAETAPGFANGIVYFYDNNVFFGQGTLTNGVATYNTSFALAGTHPITAYFPATGNFQASTFFTLNQVVQLTPTSTVMSSSANPATPGQTVTLRADITSSAPNPTGVVNFYEGATFLGSGGVGANYAVLIVNGFSIGTHALHADYVPTGNFAASTSPVFNQVAGLISTTTNVTSNLNPAAVGATITFTATVTAATGTPTGVVFFYDNNSTNIGQGTVNGAGVATMTINTLTAGTHPITATFQGTGNYANSSFFTLNQFVGTMATTLNVTSSANPSTPGQSVTLTVTVTAAQGVPTGQVFLYDNNVNFGGAITLVNGTGSITTSTFAAGQPLIGTHPITGQYVGTGAYQNSTFFTVQQRVGNANTVTLARTAGNSPSTAGQSLTFTATIVEAVAAVPTGTMTFYVNGTPNAATVSGNTATFTTTSLTAAGSPYTIVAVYGGDGNFLPSPNSNSLSQTVTAVATAVDVQGGGGGSTTNRPSSGDSMTFTFSQPMTPGTIASGLTVGGSVSVTARLQRGAGNNTPTNLTFDGTNLGTVLLGDTGTTHFLTTSGTAATATVTLTMTSSTVLTVTFPNNFAGAAMASVTNPGNRTLNWTPSATATDANGFPMSAGAVNETGGGDGDF